MEKFMVLLMTISIKSSILVGIILLTKKVFKRLLTPKTNYLIWFLLILSLALPIAPQSSISIYKIPQYILENKEPTNQEQTTFIIDSNEVETQNDFQKTKIMKSVNQENSLPNEAGNDSAISSKLSLTQWFMQDFYKVLFLLWLMGTVVIGVYVLFNQLSFYKKIKKEDDIKEGLADMLESKKKVLSIKKAIGFKTSEQVSTPCLLGYIKPYIIIPKKLLQHLDTQKMELVLLHELCHLKRKDILLNFTIIFFQIIHWFNPVLWWGFKKMKSDMEVACDEMVLRNLKKENHIYYGRVIIELVEVYSKADIFPVTANIVEDKLAIKKRIFMIKNFKKPSILITMVGLLITAIVGCSAISAPLTKENIIPIEPQITQDEAKQFQNEKWIGDDYYALEKAIGEPYIKNVYFNNKDIDYNDALENIISESIFTVEDEEALYVYIEKDKVVDVKIKGYEGITDKNYRFEDSDYKIVYHNHEEKIQDQAYDINQLQTELLGKSIHAFNEKFNLTYGNIEAFDKQGDLQLNYYPLQLENSTECLSAFYVLVKDGNIVSIKYDEPIFIYDRIDEHFEYNEQDEAMQILESGSYYDYYNEDASMQVVLYLESNVIKGSLVDNEKKKWELKGTIEGGEVYLYILNNGVEKEFFKGNMKTVDDITGTMIDPKTNKKTQCNLDLLSIISAAYGHRYEAMGSKNDQEIEDFAQKIQKAIAGDDKDTLAKMVQYPIYVNIQGEKVEIPDSKAFKVKYDQIISKQFKEIILNAYTSNMFVRYDGVMLGEGLNNIWFRYEGVGDSPLKIVGIWDEENSIETDENEYVFEGDINNVFVALKYQTNEGEFFSEFQKVTSKEAVKEIGKQFMGMKFKDTLESFNENNLNYKIQLKNNDKLIAEVRFYGLDKIVLLKDDRRYVSTLSEDQMEDLIFSLITKFKPIIFE